MNIRKTKIVVFKRGGHCSRNERWYYNNIQIDIVNGFTYVGAYFTNRMSTYKMAEAVSIKAKTVLNYVLNALSKLQCIPVNSFMKIFDVKICPMLLYGSELWGMQNMHCIESIQTYACKRLLNVPLNASNDAILGDLGRYPLFVNSAKRCIKYWLRIIKLPRTRLVRLCYEMLLYFDEIGHVNWVSHVRNNLFSNGFGYVWLQQSVGNESMFLTQYVERLKNQQMQNWNANCANNNKLKLYKEYKNVFGREPYITIIDVNKFRTALAKFRCSSTNLMIEYGRYFNIEVDDRTCVYCETCIEDEFHFLLECPLYADLRNDFIDQYFTNNPSRVKFCRLMNCTNERKLRNLAMFIYYAFRTRNEFLHSRM